MEYKTQEKEAFHPDYNTTRKKLILPEYGRHIQSMVDMLFAIDNKDERTKAAKVIVNVMGNFYPQLRDVPDFRHKLWDHLAIMSNFQLDIDWPYPLPSMEEWREKPDALEYNNHQIRYRHYGLMAQKLVAEIKKQEDVEAKRQLTVLTANHMKKSFLTWNKDTVEDAQIYHDLNVLYGGDLEMLETLSLARSKDLLQKKEIASKGKNGTNGGNGKKKRKKKR